MEILRRILGDLRLYVGIKSGSLYMQCVPAYRTRGLTLPHAPPLVWGAPALCPAWAVYNIP